MIESRRCTGSVLALLCLPSAAWSQTLRSDTTRADSLARYTLPPIEVTVTRSDVDLNRLPFAVEVVTGDDVGKGRPRLGLDEALVGVPGVLAANRQNYSLDETLSIRGFGSRSAFGVRGLKILLDGIPQTLPDGQGQLTNVDLDDVGRVEVLRGSVSSLYGNASGGVISLSTASGRTATATPNLRILGGAYGLVKYHGGLDLPVGHGSLSLSGVRTSSDGFRDHSNADLRQGRARLALPLGGSTVTVVAQVADDPTIKDPGALTATEMATDPTLANPLSKSRDAGKGVSQEQVGVTVSRGFAHGLTANLTGFGLKRVLKNPTTAAYIEVGRWAYGARGTVGLPVSLGSRTAVLTAGADAQWQRDDRINENIQLTALTRNQLERVAEVGPFLQAAIDALPSLTLSLGGRYDHVRFSVDDYFLSDGDDSGVRPMSAVSGSAGLAFHASGLAAPYANVSTSFETPTTTELANRPTGPGGFNPDLGPQKAVNYEVGVRGGQGSITYSAALYRANVRGELIPFEVPGDPSRRFYRNAGSTQHEGAELGAGLSLPMGVSLRGGYTYSRHRFVDYRVTTGTTTAVYDGNTLPGVPAHYFKGAVTFRLGRYGRVSVEESFSSSLFVNDANTTSNAGWAATAIRPGLDVATHGYSFSVFGGVDNLFDRHYAASVQVNAALGRYFEPSPGRNAYLGVEMRPAK